MYKRQAELNAAKDAPHKGYSSDVLAERLNVEPSELRPVLEVLQSLDWVGRLTEENAQGQARQVLLIDPALASVSPLADRLLLLRASAADPIWEHTGLDHIAVAHMLPRPLGQ